MVDSVASSENYQDFEKKNNRFLNMLTDNDRNLRRQGLEGIRRSLNDEKDERIQEYFYRERLAKRLVIVLEDQIEKNREISIEIIQSMTEKFELKEESQILLPAIAARMNNIPYAETSEETRVLLIDLLTVCLKSDKYQFSQHYVQSIVQFVAKLGEISNMLSKAAQDANPDMKIKVAQFGGFLSRELQEKTGAFMKNTILALNKNLQHQHAKVRKATLIGLKDIIVSRGAQTIENISLKDYDPVFVQFLLNGIADENKDIQEKSIQLLEEHGRLMKDALIQLGEEDAKMAE